MANYGKHIENIVDILDKFNPENHSVDDFLAEMTKDLKTLGVPDQAFVLETLSGCIEYKSLWDIVVDGFYARDGKKCMLSEHNLYVVICYLATFKLEELGLQIFSKIVKSQDIVKMHKIGMQAKDVRKMYTFK